MFLNYEVLKALTKNFFKKIFGDTAYKKSFRIYFSVVIIGAALLFSPLALTNDWTFKNFQYTKNSATPFNFFDSLFTAISAFTNTGLTTHTTFTTFSFFGQCIILLLIQFGGIGFLTALIFLWQFVTKTKKINFEQGQLLHFERGNNTRASAFEIAKTGIFVLLITEIIGAILLTFFFYFQKPETFNSITPNNKLHNDLKNSIWAGIFHSISASNNAGFDIISAHSITPYRNGYGNFLSVVLCIQSFIGGIGYPVFYEIYTWKQNRKKHNYQHQYTLFTKISVSMYIVITFISIYVALMIEFRSRQFLNRSSLSNWGNNIANKVWNLIYLTFSARSAGFTAINISELSEKTQWLLTILMFIGTSPASTGGGIRTITLFLVFFQIFHVISRRKHLSIFKRTIEQKNANEALFVFLVAIFLLIIASIFIVLNKGNWTLGSVIFEVSSAFGTAGLTNGVTSSTNSFGRFILLMLMFIGQLGISNALLSWSNKASKINKQYGFENIRII